MTVTDMIDAWIAGATTAQLQAKLHEYISAPESWSGRDNEARQRMVRKLRNALTDRGVQKLRDGVET